MRALRTVLYPTDFSEQAGYALPLAAALARNHRARLVVLHVVPSPAVAPGASFLAPTSGDIWAEARKRLGALLLPDIGLVPERLMVEGEPAEVILRLARETRAHLIVLGTHNRTGANRVSTGSTLGRIVGRAPCPVLTLRVLVPHPFCRLRMSPGCWS
jgi:nucleotide-binding universal stress UspA family protein